MPPSSSEPKGLINAAKWITAGALLLSACNPVEASPKAIDVNNDPTSGETSPIPFEQMTLSQQAEMYMERMNGVEILRNRLSINIDPSQLGAQGDDGLTYPNALKDGGVLTTLEHEGKKYNVIVSYSSPYFNSADLSFINQSGLNPPAVGDILGRAYYMNVDEPIQITVTANPYPGSDMAHLTLPAGSNWLVIPYITAFNSRTIPQWQTDGNGDLVVSNGQPVGTPYLPIEIQENNITQTSEGGVGYVLLALGQINEQEGTISAQVVGVATNPNSIQEIPGQENTPYTELIPQQDPIDTSQYSNQQ